jgi:hypothetical protein
MKLTREEKEDILSKYEGNTSDKLLNHLKRNYPVVTYEILGKPYKMIIINEKNYYLEGNKKFLVNKLTNILEDEWVFLDRNELRRTIKKYIDGYLIN